ncbi:ABC-F family ATP-binding cassette domain-containing protein [Pedobacter heparinus]|uniref:ABC-F family ATP-binding cassette domain-containing protein n=1 Tax=Pedobacter heparinus TaxID=984 RepID=UPI00292F99EF|nr:ABC-F family ATP-binding cassette domain-containing protein [Pedobacter heparinus]
MITLQNITYIHPDRDLLFSGLNLIINKKDKIALIGDNGTGKSILMKIMAGALSPSQGRAEISAKPYYVPQIVGQFNDYSVAKALQVADKLQALNLILNGELNQEHLNCLDEDWTIEERCKSALAHWKLDGLDLEQKMGGLSGGQKTKVLLAGIRIHQPEIVLLDEPSNHLDAWSRKMLYDDIRSAAHTLVVISHDRALLNLLDHVAELSEKGIAVYGGNYDFYGAQKSIANEALNQDLKSKEKALRKAKETEKIALERQQKLDARGKKKQEKAGLPTISMNTLRNNAEKSTSRMKGVQQEKVIAVAKELGQLRAALPDIHKMKMDFNPSLLHSGKILITATNVNFGYAERMLWKQALNFQVSSGERIVIKGGNGSGKTTLIQMILARIDPLCGSLKMADVKAIYIDQDYSLIEDELSVYEQAQAYNSGGLQEHEIKIRLNRFLFDKTFWDKPCATLSGGEKMRLMLCTLTIGTQAPDLMVLDEPTNNLDIQNTEILTAAVNAYEGTLLVVSHDEYFLKEIAVTRSIDL